MFIFIGEYFYLIYYLLKRGYLIRVTFGVQNIGENCFELKAEIDILDVLYFLDCLPTP